MDTKANWLQTRFLRLSRLRKQLMFVLWTLGGFRAWLHFRRYPPVFIVGAPRSGTTLLFQILSMQARVTPVFEPNKLWVLALGPHEDDTYRARVTMLGKLRLLWLYYSLLEDNCPILLSKDPKDSLRVCLLHDVFPTARFVHIIRDGRDVVASVTRIWHGDSFRVDVENDWVHVRIPRYRELLDKPTHVKASLMWARCVQSVVDDFGEIPDNQFMTVRYEDLLLQPQHVAEETIRFLLSACDEEALLAAARSVSAEVLEGEKGRFRMADTVYQGRGFAKSWIPNDVLDDAGSGTMSTLVRVGKWKQDLAVGMLEDSLSIIEPLLRRFGYV